jgi:hypothetical protein
MMNNVNSKRKLVNGTIIEDKEFSTTSIFYESKDVNQIVSHTVYYINRTKNKVVLTNSERIDFDSN